MKMVFVKSGEHVYELHNSCLNISSFLSEISSTKNHNFGTKYNPITINEYNKDIITFFNDYCEFNKKKEIDVPSSPLMNTHLSNIFIKEYELFQFLLDNYIDMKLDDHLHKIKDYVVFAEEMKCETLLNKLCAIIVYIIKLKK